MKMVFRVSKGNVITHSRDIEGKDLSIPNDEDQIQEIIDPKNVNSWNFVIFFKSFFS